MTTTVFEWREDDEYGEFGWAPKKFKGFNIVQGFGIAHDALEHFPHHELGDLAEELEALGAVINVRVMGGYRDIKGFYAISEEESFGSELAEFLRTFPYAHEDSWRKPPRTRALSDEYAERHINESLRIAKKYLHKYYSEDLEKLEGRLDELLNEFRDWLRIGYRKSRKRFHYADQYELAHFFLQIEKGAERYREAYPGQELFVRINAKQLTLKMFESNPFYDY